MSETQETTPEVTPEPAKTEETATISEDEMKQIDAVITKTDDQAVAENIYLSTYDKSLGEIKAELAAVKETNQKAAEEAEKARLAAELEAEKKKATNIQHKHLVAQQPNPAKPQPVEQPAMSNEQQWQQFEAATKVGAFKASFKGK